MKDDHRAMGGYEEFAGFHDLLYADRRAEIDFYTSLVCGPRSRILELGCGTGAIVAGVAHRLTSRGEVGVRAVGLDRSESMLKWARSRSSPVDWVQSDMVKPAVDGPFDLVICAFNTLQMLESGDAVVRTLDASRQLLQTDGLIAFDVYNPDCETKPTSSPESRLDRVVGAFKDAQGRTLQVQEDAVEDASGEFVTLHWRITDPSRMPPTVQARLVVRLRHYSPQHVERLVGAAGLRMVERYGDVRKSPFSPLRSGKQVVLCGL